MPHGAELFSHRGMLGDASLSPFLGAVPNVLEIDDSPWTVLCLIATGFFGAVLIAIGRWDRAGALVVWYVLACLFGRNPLTGNPSLPVAGWLLLLHAALPKPKAAGARLAEDRSSVDLEQVAGWVLPRPFLVAAWTVLAVSYSYSGYTRLLSSSWVSGDAIAIVLDDPLAGHHGVRAALSAFPDWMLKALTWTVLYVELLFAPLALLKRFRAWLWSIMLCVQLGLPMLFSLADLTMPMLLMHLLTFEQRWLTRFEKQRPATVYYDGHCALCHRLVRFALIEDRRGRLRFAPLQSDAAVEYLGDERYRRRLDTLVVRSADGETYEKSAAAVEVLYRLGGWWSLLAAVMARVPKAVRDRAYEAVGMNRLRFGTTEALCPLVPNRLRARFLGEEGLARADGDDDAVGVPALVDRAPGVDRSGAS